VKPSDRSFPVSRPLGCRNWETDTNLLIERGLLFPDVNSQNDTLVKQNSDDAARRITLPTKKGCREMIIAPLSVDLTQVPPVPWAWVDERTYAAIRGCSVKVLQRERRLNVGCPFRRINGTTVRYKFGDITAFMESQPGGGGAERAVDRPAGARGRPRRLTT
jgi:hypothetical protein